MGISPPPPINFTLYTHELDSAEIVRFFREDDAFSRHCTFVHEITGEKLKGLPSTDWQLLIIRLWNLWHFINVNKPRQARTSEAFLRETLKHAEYRVACRAILAVNKDSVAIELFRRLNDNYENQDKAIQVPLRKGASSGSKNSITFIHGGGIDVVSAQERAPSVGASPRILWLSEFSKIAPSERQKDTYKNLLPGGAKKPDLMVGRESTPGVSGDYAHLHWLNDLAGKTRYFPVFLNWLRSREYMKTPEPGWRPNDIERELIDLWGGSVEHARFIHDIWMDFGEDWEAVWNMYPRGETDGWESASGSSGFPADAFRADLPEVTEGRSCPIIANIRGFYELRKPEEEEAVLLVCDPASGVGKGDPTGIVAFSEKGDQIAEFIGRVDPLRAADIIGDAAVYYRDLTGVKPVVAIESNKGEVATALRDRRRLGDEAACAFEFYNDRRHNVGANEIGWYSTEGKKKRAETRLVSNKRRGSLILRGKATVTQCGSYDRETAWKREGGHHFELAICAIIGADVMVTLGWLGDVSPKEGHDGEAASPIVVDPRTALVNELLQKSKASMMGRRRRR